MYKPGSVSGTWLIRRLVVDNLVGPWWYPQSRLTENVAERSNSFDVEPIVSTYPSIAFVLSVLGSATDINAIFAHLYYGFYFPTEKFLGSSKRCPSILDHLTFKRLESLGLADLADLSICITYKNANAIHGEICSWIDRGAFVLFHGNEFYLPGTQRFGVSDFRHPFLIRGVRSRCREFLVAGYFEGVYGERWIEWGLLIRSICSRALFDGQEAPYDHKALFVQFICIRSGVKVVVVPETIRQQILGYLCSTAPGSIALQIEGQECPAVLDFQPRLYECLYGAEGSNAVERYFDAVRDQQIPGDLRVSKIYLEHKTAMYARLRFLENHFGTGHATSGLYRPIIANARSLHHAFWSRAISLGNGATLLNTFSSKISFDSGLERTLLENILMTVWGRI